MRWILLLVTLTIPDHLVAQETDISQLEERFETATGTERLEALDDYVTALKTQDRSAAASLLTDFFAAHVADTNDQQWGRLFLTMAMLKYEAREYERCMTYLDSASMSLEASSAQDAEALGRYYNTRGSVFQRRKSLDSSAFYYDKALLHAEQSKNKELVASVYNNLGTNHWYKGEYREAILPYSEALFIRQQLGDTSKIADIYRNIGLAYRSMGDYSLSIEQYELALPLYESVDNKRGLANLLNSLGVLYKELSDFDQALRFHERSLAIRKSLKDSLAWSVSLDNIGSAYIEKGDFGRALDALLISEQLKLGREGDVRVYNTLSNIGVCYDKLEDHRRAVSYFDRALEGALAFGDERAIAMVYNNLNLLYRDEGKLQAALDYGQKSLELSKRIDTPDALATAHLYLSKTYKSLGRFSDALAHYEDYSTYQLELFDENAASERSRLLLKYDFEQQTNNMLRQEQELQNANKESEFLRERQLILIGLVVALLVIMSLLVFIFRSRFSKIQLEKEVIDQRSRMLELSKQNLDQELKLKELRLTSFAEQLSRQNELLDDLRKEQSADQQQSLNDLLGKIDGRSKPDMSWQAFRLEFDKVHGDFIPRLSQIHQGLTSNELDICILLKLNLTNKDIASILGSSYESVKKSVQRLYKKLEMENADELRSYLISI
ncbi:MAG: tetratricopeptide repeat protein [Cyclobacteriaceae bacterium]